MLWKYVLLDLKKKCIVVWIYIDRSICLRRVDNNEKSFYVLYEDVDVELL